MDKIKYIDGYNKANYTQVLLKFRKDTENDILKHLNSKQSKMGYIKQLIIEDMKRGGNNDK